MRSPPRIAFSMNERVSDWKEKSFQMMPKDSLYLSVETVLLDVSKPRIGIKPK
jgi:hypothetical protein